MKNIVYLDSDCGMCTFFGMSLKKYNCDIVIKKNKKINFPVSLTNKTIIAFDAKKEKYYFQFQAVFFALSKSNTFLLRIIFSFLLFLFLFLNLSFLYEYMSKNRKLIFKQKDICNLWENNE